MDTIAALSTAPGGAIGVIRISGPDARALLDLIFTPARPLVPRMLTLGALTLSGRVIDRPMAVFFPGPATYTGEDLAELHCHGSTAILSAALEGLYALGARPAQPGEFTRRAFLHGKIDLFEAEAVGDLVSARSAEAAVNAAAQLGGHLSTAFAGLSDELRALCARFLAVIDYPDEDIEDLDTASIGDALDRWAARLEALRAGYERGRVLREGLPCAIVGRPNAGKSTLLNALLGYDRAIVTDIAGTTRDMVEESLCLSGVVLRLQDTAGLRETDDPVERLGVGRARDAVRQAAAHGLVLAVFDGAAPLTEDDQNVIAEARGARTIAVVNKADRGRVWDDDVLGEGWAAVVPLSAKGREGLDGLRDAILSLTGLDRPAGDEGLVTNLRQAAALTRAGEALRRAQATLRAGLTPDAVVADLEDALGALGELTGQAVRESIIEEIFANFCVGK